MSSNNKVNREALRKKTVWERPVIPKKKLSFILHYRTKRTFLVCIKKSQYLSLEQRGLPPHHLDVNLLCNANVQRRLSTNRLWSLVNAHPMVGAISSANDDNDHDKHNTDIIFIIIITIIIFLTESKIFGYFRCKWVIQKLYTEMKTKLWEDWRISRT